MTARNVLIAGLASAALMLPPAAAFAQSAAAPTPAPPPTSQAKPDQNGQASGQQSNGQQANASQDPTKNWLKVCDPLPNGQKACIMRQVVLANGQFLGSFLLRDDPGQESRLLAVAAVPLGVLLPFGLTWQIDGGKPIRVPYMLCDPQSCASQLVINEAYVNSLKKGAKLTLTAKNRQNQDLTVNINLAGFTTVYDGDTALTFDQFRKAATSGGPALEQQLQDRAEQLRKQLDGGSSPSSGDTAKPAAGK
jgi:invasion protein IalB